MAIDRQVRRAIPMGFNHHKRPVFRMRDDWHWGITTLQAEIFTNRLNAAFGTDYKFPGYTMEYFNDLCDKVGIKRDVAINSLGTLGGGNHFIEFSISEATGNTGVTLHAGSRGLGLKTANYWQGVATKRWQDALVGPDETLEFIKANYPKEEWNDRLRAPKRKKPKPTGLEYLEGDDWYGYLMDMNFCQIYAEVNLNIMMQMILRRLNLNSTLMLSAIHTIHNYISPDDLIIRKGAVRSIDGERMLIPANMEDGIIVAEGKSNPEWNNSAPHGAGRLHGRKAMKRRKDIDEKAIKQRMADKGIWSSVVPKDEVKEAYKGIDFIKRVIEPTATIVDHLTPVLPIKADD